MKPYSYEILPWDSSFFNCRVGRIVVLNSNFDGVSAVEDAAPLDLLYVNSSFSLDIENIGALSKGYEEERLVFRKDLLSPSNVSDKVRSGNAEDASEDVKSLAVSSGKYSRFKLDSRVPTSKFKELYELFLIKSLSREIADEVLFYEEDEEVLGLVTVRRKGEVGDIGIISVRSDARGKGIGMELMRGAENFVISMGVSQMTVATQGENMVAAALYRKCGYTVDPSEYVYHFWKEDFETKKLSS